jgi:hypothetical protein
MSAGTLKQVLVELTRGGCRVEQLGHNPGVVTFRSPRGARLKLSTDQSRYQILDVEGGREPSTMFGSLHEAVRAACLS